MAQRLLVISPVRNEAAHIELVARSLARQTRPPDLWVVVDDRSEDDTPSLLAHLESELDFMHVLQAPPVDAEGARDRLALAAEARAFNLALASVPWQAYTHVAKLDGDIELSPRYFEQLLDAFAEDPRLGLAGGVLRERDGEGWAPAEEGSDYHVRGALKCYTSSCLAAIGGMQERLGWDTIDEVYARMRGFHTRTLPALVGLHHRPCASADGILRGRARHGRCLYVTHYPPAWVWLRSLKTAREQPRLLSGAAFLAGYLWAGATRAPRVGDREFREFIRHELGQRARRAARLRVSAGAPTERGARAGAGAS